MNERTFIENSQLGKKIKLPTAVECRRSLLARRRLRIAPQAVLALVSKYWYDPRLNSERLHSMTPSLRIWKPKSSLAVVTTIADKNRRLQILNTGRHSLLLNRSQFLKLSRASPEPSADHKLSRLFDA